MTRTRLESITSELSAAAPGRQVTQGPGSLCLEPETVTVTCRSLDRWPRAADRAQTTAGPGAGPSPGSLRYGPRLESVNGRVTYYDSEEASGAARARAAGGRRARAAGGRGRGGRAPLSAWVR